MGHDLITDYVDALRVHLQGRRDAADAADVVDEVEDHLREHADRLVATGVHVDEAQRVTLERFGELGLVARNFARSPTVELAVPTTTTRAAGVVGLGAAAAWLWAGFVGATGGHTGLLTTWTLERYTTWIVALAIALLLTIATLAGALARVGRLRCRASLACFVFAVPLVGVMAVFGWAVSAVMSLFAVVVLAATVRPPPHERFVGPLRRLVMAWPLGLTALFVFNEVLPVGPADSYGDHPVARLVTSLACILFSAVTLAVVGVRLLREQPSRLTPVRVEPLAVS